MRLKVAVEVYESKISKKPCMTLMQAVVFHQIDIRELRQRHKNFPANNEWFPSQFNFVFSLRVSEK